MGSQQDFTVALAAHFKKSGKMKIPEWVDLIKTNVGKELAPYDEDWYYVRCASMARHMYIRSPVGSQPSVRSTASVRATVALRPTGAREPAAWPGRHCSPLRD